MRYIPVKPQEFGAYEYGKADGFALRPNFGTEIVGIYVQGFIDGVKERVSMKNCEHYFIQFGAPIPPIMGDRVLPVISSTKTALCVLAPLYIGLRSTWIDRKYCTPVSARRIMD